MPDSDYHSGHNSPPPLDLFNLLLHELAAPAKVVDTALTRVEESDDPDIRAFSKIIAMQSLHNMVQAVINAAAVIEYEMTVIETWVNDPQVVTEGGS